MNYGKISRQIRAEEERQGMLGLHIMNRLSKDRRMLRMEHSMKRNSPTRNDGAFKGNTG